MSSSFSTRAASLTAASGLLGAAVLAALTMTYMVQAVAPDFSVPTVVMTAPLESPPPVAQPITKFTPPSEDQVPLRPPLQPASAPATSEASGDIGGPTADTIVTITRPSWLRRPSNLQRYYPARALRRGIEGDVTLDCAVTRAGALNCMVAEETPSGWDFGEAALAIAADHRMAPATRDGVSVEARYRMRVPFRID